MAKSKQNLSHNFWHKQTWYFIVWLFEIITTLSLLQALSIHQLAAQGEVSQVAVHLSKGEETGAVWHEILSSVKLYNTLTNEDLFSLQTVHCSANRMNVVLRLSCGLQRLERRQWRIFSWKRLSSSSLGSPIQFNGTNVHWCFFYLCSRAQTPKLLQSRGKVPWHWPALEVMGILLSLSSDTEPISTLMTGYSGTH